MKREDACLFERAVVACIRKDNVQVILKGIAARTAQGGRAGHVQTITLNGCVLLNRVWVSGQGYYTFTI